MLTNFHWNVRAENYKDLVTDMLSMTLCSLSHERFEEDFADMENDTRKASMLADYIYGPTMWRTVV